MRVAVTCAIFAVVMTGCADTRGAVRLEQASAGKPYDFLVHVKTTYDYKYNPDVSEDRKLMALAFVKRDCPAARVVGQDKIITEIWGVTSSKPDYVVFIRCM